MSINPNTFVSGLAQNTRLPQAPDQMNAVNQIMQAGLRQKEIAEMHAWRDRIIDAQEKARDATQFQSMFGPLLGQASQAQNQADYDKVNKNWDTMAKVFNKASSGHINPGSLSDFISGPGKQVLNSNNPFAAIMNWAGATPNTQAQQATGNVLAGMGKSAI